MVRFLISILVFTGALSMLFPGISYSQSSRQWTEQRQRPERTEWRTQSTRERPLRNRDIQEAPIGQATAAVIASVVTDVVSHFLEPQPASLQMTRSAPPSEENVFVVPKENVVPVASSRIRPERPSRQPVSQVASPVQKECVKIQNNTYDSNGNLVKSEEKEVCD